MKSRVDTVRAAIGELAIRFEKNSLTYLSEADLQSDLFSLLLPKFENNQEIEEVFVWGTDNPQPTQTASTRPLHSELLLPEGRVDLAILDLKAVRMGVNSKGKLGYVQLESGDHIFVEIKASRTNRSSVTSMEHWKRLISKDLNKLARLSNTSFLACFDFGHLLKDAEVEEIRTSAPSNVELVYAVNTHKDVYIIPTS